MRRQACAILGVSEFATEEEIKSAYRTLVKQYHPDTGYTQNPQYYQNVVQAYEYLKLHPIAENAQNPYGNSYSYQTQMYMQGNYGMYSQNYVQNQGMYAQGAVQNQRMYAQGVVQNQTPRTGKVVGGSSNQSSHFSYDSSREYAQFEKGYQQQRKERKVAFNEYMKQEKKRQEEYDHAMEAIRAIRMAEALKAMIKAEQ